MTQPIACTAPEFYLPGGRDGVLLIHGLSGTPTEMRFVGKGLQRAGFTVYAPRLAGHCADELALLATGWEDWYASVETAAERLRDRVDRMFVAGLSMGAVLTLALAARRPLLMEGVALYGVTFRYDGWSIPKIARLAFLLPLATRLGIGRDRRFCESFPYGIKDERTRQRIVECMRAGDSAAAGLLGIPWPSLAQAYELAASVRRELSAVVTPCLILHAEHDDIADVRNARMTAARVSGPVDLRVFTDSYHMLTLDRERQRVVDLSVDFFHRPPRRAFMNVHDTVFQSIAHAAGVEASAVNPAATLRDLGIPSLDALELLFELEEKFGLQLKDEDLDLGTATVTQLVAALEGAIARKGSLSGAVAAT
jgi:carboxylesterase